MHGHIERRPRAGGGSSYRITYVAGQRADGTPDRRRATYDTEREAKEALARLTIARAEGRLTVAHRLTFEAYLARWLADTKRLRVEETTLASYEELIRRHIIPELGDVPLAGLMAARIECFLVEKALNGRRDGKGGLGDRSIRYLYTLIRAALEDARKRQLVAVNQASLITPPARRLRDRAEHVIWTEEHLALFLTEAARHPLWPLWPVALSTGLRREEVLGLRWRDVDLSRGLLRVVQVVVLIGGKGAVKPRAKNRESHRVISLDGHTVALLRDHQTVQAFAAKRVGPFWQDHDLVFPSVIGTPLDPNNCSKAFRTLIRRLDLPYTTLHGLRHMMATYGLSGGQDLVAVSRRLGHSRPSTTSDIYAHLRPGTDQQLAHALGDAIFGARSPNPSPKAEQA